MNKREENLKKIVGGFPGWRLTGNIFDPEEYESANKKYKAVSLS